MAFETPAERKLAVAEADKTVLGFIKRTRTMVQEASGIVSALAAGKADLENAKAASDTALAADDQNAMLSFENANIAASITQITGVLAAATALKNAIDQLV